MSSMLAFVVNLSSYTMIRSTSTLTYNMLSYLKMIIIIMVDYLLEGDLMMLKPIIAGIFFSSGKFD